MVNAQRLWLSSIRVFFAKYGVHWLLLSVILGSVWFVEYRYHLMYYFDVKYGHETRLGSVIRFKAPAYRLEPKVAANIEKAKVASFKVWCQGKQIEFIPYDAEGELLSTFKLVARSKNKCQENAQIGAVRLGEGLSTEITYNAWSTNARDQIMFQAVMMHPSKLPMEIKYLPEGKS